MDDIQKAPTVRREMGKRSDMIAEQIKQWLADGHIALGQKLPQERELIEMFGVSKGTVREALKSLEVQGVVRVKTGPSGGASITQVTTERANQLLANYFTTREVSLQEIYAVRKRIEPDLAVAVVGHLSETDFQTLESLTGFCLCEPLHQEAGSRQRIAELDFHDVLADACPNALLGFYCRFVNNLLKSLPVCTDIYARPQKKLAKQAREHHVSLLRAFRDGNAEAARKIMFKHMEEAEAIMLARVALLQSEDDRIIDAG